MPDRDDELSKAFDGQAAGFERARVQTDPGALARLAALVELPAGSLLLDAGCGPGLVAERLLDVGYRVHGVDLSPEMVRRARARCARFGDRARFEEGSVLALRPAAPFDGAVSRLVLHHVEDPAAFVRRLAELVRPGGAVVVSDHTGDPDPARHAWMQEIERARDRTHARNVTAGELVDLLVCAGLDAVVASEEPFELDFDEWFDRGTPALPKEEVRARVLGGGRARGFDPEPRPDGGVTIHCWRSYARGVRPRDG